MSTPQIESHQLDKTSLGGLLGCNHQLRREVQGYALDLGHELAMVVSDEPIKEITWLQRPIPLSGQVTRIKMNIRFHYLGASALTHIANFLAETLGRGGLIGGDRFTPSNSFVEHLLIDFTNSADRSTWLRDYIPVHVEFSWSLARIMSKILGKVGTVEMRYGENAVIHEIPLPFRMRRRLQQETVQPQ